MQRVLRVFLLMSFILYVLVGCSGFEITDQHQQTRYEQMYEQLPDWCDQVWQSGFTEAKMSGYSFAENSLTIHLNLEDEIDDCSTTIEEAFDLFDRNDYYYTNQNDESVELAVEIVKTNGSTKSGCVEISNNISFNGMISTDSINVGKIDKDTSKKIGIRCVLLYKYNFDIEQDINRNIDFVYVTDYKGDIDYINRFTNIDTMHIWSEEDDDIDTLNTFISDMEARGIEVIID